MIGFFRKREQIFLFIGDVIAFYIALWLTLYLRYLEFPSANLLYIHTVPFTILFIVWIGVYFIAGLYNNHTLLFKRKLPSIILNAQLVNVGIAAIFFFFVPYFGITPKTNLVIYLVVSFFLMFSWRLYIFPSRGVRNRAPAVLINGGQEFKELHDEVNGNNRYDIYFAEVIDLSKAKSGGVSDKLFDLLRDEKIEVAVVNTSHEKIADIFPQLYKPIFSEIRFIEANELYEEIFDRVPLSQLSSPKFLEQIDSPAGAVYDIVKRGMDVVVAFVLFILSLLLYPVVFAAIKLDDGGKTFIKQRRVGQHTSPITLRKFRTMQYNEEGAWIGETNNTVTRVGKFLRRTRIDELPQLWNVVRGDLSLVGPRPDVVGLDSRIREQIPQYNIRYAVKPGLSGWAQIKQDVVPQSVDESRRRFMYDLYYVKNRSLMLDIRITLQTLKTLLSRSGK